MIVTHGMVADSLRDYGAPNNKIMRMVRDGELVPIIRGLYETDAAAPPYALAAGIYGPSYLSFEWALSFHGLIPERTVEITSATFEKGRRKVYNTPFGRYSFRDIPSQAFPLGIKTVQQGDYFFRVAIAEKALCDQLCKMHSAQSVKELAALVDGLRIDCDALYSLDAELIASWFKAYRKTNVNLLCKLLERGKR